MLTESTLLASPISQVLA